MGCCVANSPQIRSISQDYGPLTRESDLINNKSLIFSQKLNPRDSFTILNKIGEGSFGTVYRVIDKKTKQIRAMKMIKKEVLMEQDDEQEFLKEIEILRQLDHPHIVKIFEYFTDERYYYLIIEFVDGEELYDSISEWKGLTEDKTATIMKQLFSAVFYLHSKGIIHRDLKPENVMVEKSNEELRIKLIDFGTCTYLEKGHVLNMQVGTPLYLSPDILREKYDHATDLWSCGVSLYLLLGGFPPFYSTNHEELFNQIRKVKYSFDFKEFCNVSEEAKDLVKNLLVKEPKSRLTAEEALKHPWFDILKGKNESEIDSATLSKVFHNIKTFKIKENFHRKAIAYIVHLVQNSQEHEDLHTIFKKLDENGDGRLNYTELREGFTRVFGKTLTEFEFEKVVKSIDQDSDGFVEYEEFLRVALDRRLILSQDNLRLAFDKFDANGDGKLNLEEIKVALGFQNSYIVDVINRNQDKQEISFEEFCELMQNIFVKAPKANTGSLKPIPSGLVRRVLKGNSFNLSNPSGSGNTNIARKRMQISNLDS